MKLLMVGCSHHRTAIEMRERLAFSSSQAGAALDQMRKQLSPGRSRAAVDL